MEEKITLQILTKPRAGIKEFENLNKKWVQPEESQSITTKNSGASMNNINWGLILKRNQSNIVMNISHMALLTYANAANQTVLPRGR